MLRDPKIDFWTSERARALVRTNDWSRSSNQREHELRGYCSIGGRVVLVEQMVGPVVCVDRSVGVVHYEETSQFRFFPQSHQKRDSLQLKGGE